MKKVRIKIEINDHIIEGIGTINNNILSIKNKEEKLSYDITNADFIKENKEIIIELDFLNKEVHYKLVKENKQFSNNLIILSLTNNHKQVMINYQIEQEVFNLKINYETI